MSCWVSSVRSTIAHYDTLQPTQLHLMQDPQVTCLQRRRVIWKGRVTFDRNASIKLALSPKFSGNVGQTFTSASSEAFKCSSQSSKHTSERTPLSRVWPFGLKITRGLFISHFRQHSRTQHSQRAYLNSDKKLTPAKSCATSRSHNASGFQPPRRPKDTAALAHVFLRHRSRNCCQ